MTQPFDRRSFLAGGLALGAGAVILGSGTEWAGASLTNGPGRNGISKATPKRGGSIVFGMDTEEGGFDPTSARWDEGGFLYGRTVFDPLAIVTTAGQVVPYLAQSITSNADFTLFTITLRPNIVFHDGTPLNSAALLLNLQKQKASILTGPAFSNVASVQSTGPLTVTIATKTPWEELPYYLAQAQTAYIAAPSMLNDKNGTTHPVGTGPFIFKEWVPNSHFTATANPHYWRKGLPYLSQITFKPIIDPSSRVDALQSGTIDIMHTNTPRSFGTFRGNHKWAYVDNSGTILGQPDVNCVMLNTSSAPLNNQALRKALAMATNNKQYAKVIDFGINQPMSGLFLPGSPYYTSTSYPSYNQKQAAKLVKQVQQATGGKQIAFTLISTNNPDTERAAQYLQQAWGEVGVKVSINIQEQSALINDALAGTYQATMWRQFGAVNPDLNYVWWSTTTTGPPLPLNMARNSDARIQAALETGRTTSSAAERVKAYQQVNQHMAEDIPYVYLDRSTWAVIANPKVQNFVNPTAPSGAKGLGFDAGVIWPTQIWVS